MNQNGHVALCKFLLKPYFENSLQLPCNVMKNKSNVLTDHICCAYNTLYSPSIYEMRAAQESRLVCTQAVNHCELCSSLRGLGHGFYRGLWPKMEVIQTEGFHALSHSCCSSVVLKLLLYQIAQSQLNCCQLPGYVVKQQVSLQCLHRYSFLIQRCLGVRA